MLLLIPQILGAMTAAAVVSGLFPGQLAVTTTLGAGASIAQGFFIEMFLTAQLVCTIFMLAAEKHKATPLAPVGMYVTHLLRQGDYADMKKRSCSIRIRACWGAVHRRRAKSSP